jgi:hypothetical protein
MTNIKVSDNLADQLSPDQHNFLGEVGKKLESNEKHLNNVCSFVIDRVGKDSVPDFEKLEDNNKLQACLNHVAISLVSGSVKEKEITSLLEK